MATKTQNVTRNDGAGIAAMPPRVRKVVLVLHIAVSVAWLGLELCVLTLGITGLVTADPSCATLSVFKPWGKTAYGRRKAAERVRG